MSFYLTLQNVSILFILIVIGYIAGKFNIVRESSQKDITGLTLNVMMPATIILAMQVPFSLERVNKIVTTIMIMVACYIFMFVVSLIITKFMNIGENRKDILRAGILLSNTSFMGYPIILAILGEESLFYAVICGGFIFELVSWTIGTYIIGRSANQGGSSIKKAIINPGVLSILIGGTLFLTQTSIPEPINSTMKILSSATSPMAMLIVGLILSRTNIVKALGNKEIYVASLFKLVINPLIILFTLKALGFSGTYVVIPVMLLSMPTAAYVAMFSSNLGNDKNYASQLVFVCSLLSLITIPLVATLL